MGGVGEILGVQNAEEVLFADWQRDAGGSREAEEGEGEGGGDGEDAGAGLDGADKVALSGEFGQKEAPLLLAGGSEDGGESGEEICERDDGHEKAPAIDERDSSSVAEGGGGA